MNKQLLIVLTTFFTNYFTCLANNGVAISLTIHPESKTFSCIYKINLRPAGRQKSLIFNLNKNLGIDKVSSNQGKGFTVVSYYDSFQKDTLKRIIIPLAFNKASKPVITLRYSGKIPEKCYGDSVAEFSAHTNWLPTIPHREYELVNYRMEVFVNSGYKVISTNAPVKESSGRFLFEGIAPNIEITAISAVRFRRLTSTTEPKVTIYKANQDLTDNDHLLLKNSEEMISFYNRTIGLKDPIKYFTILLPGTNRDAFGLLDNSINITYSNFDTRNAGDKLILSHEISHKWWGYGVWDNDNNWLNEAFATYSSFLYLKAIGDTVNFKKELAKKIESSANAPAIKGFNVNEYDYKTYRKVIYDKGTVVLWQLNEKIGDKRFLILLGQIATSKVKTTDQLLELLEKQNGRAIRIWFEGKLTI